jgi:pimeloyl-ACP methyl ester carboxylesterase
VGRWPLIALLLLVILMSSCRGDPSGADETPGPVPDATTETITTDDGLHLDARLFAADPQRLVILLHMYPGNQESWFSTAEMLRDRGISALTFDFRGYGASEGDVEPGDIGHDVRGAIAFAHDRGYEHVLLVGASMGGTAAIVTAASDPVDGVLTLSAPVQFRGLDAEHAVTKVSAPLAVVASKGDTSAAESAETFEAKANIDPRWVLLVDGRAHGTDLLTSPAAPQVNDLILAFIERVWGSSGQTAS